LIFCEGDSGPGTHNERKKEKKEKGKTGKGRGKGGRTYLTRGILIYQADEFPHAATKRGRKGGGKNNLEGRGKTREGGKGGKKVAGTERE